MQTAPDVFILAATHFDEVALVTCLSELRGEGITTVLITPTPGLLNGKRGITLRPDLSLAQISDFVVKDRQMVIIAGGAESAATALTDPRAHQLLQHILAAGGTIVGMWHTCQFIEALGLEQLQDANHFLRQEGEETAVFIQKLINHVMSK
jgi:putative intracellular protease/amidase